MVSLSLPRILAYLRIDNALRDRERLPESSLVQAPETSINGATAVATNFRLHYEKDKESDNWV